MKATDKNPKEVIADAVREADLTKLDGWSAFRKLADNTVVEEVELFDDEIVINGDNVGGPINVSVVIITGKEKEDHYFETFPGSFHGHIDSEKGMIIDDISIDTSSFFE